MKKYLYLFFITVVLFAQSVFASSDPHTAYQRAIHATMLPKATELSNSLIEIPLKPVRVVTWMNSADLTPYKSGNNWTTTAPEDIWVTVVPEIKAFCQALVKNHPVNLAQLTLRLEQRLGLPPASGANTFLEIVIKDPSKPANLFRPCQNPSVTSAQCDAKPPLDNDTQYANWFYRQYYQSFAEAQPTQYPWTALGYTFDWAENESGDFMRFGASEFVIPQGAPSEIVRATKTAQYCQLQYVE